MNPVAPFAAGQPLYRPFLILALTLLVVMALVVYALWRTQHPDEELSTIDRLREFVRAVLIVTLTSAFVILSLEGKISAEIYAQTFGIIIAFLFGQKNGERLERQRTPREPPSAAALTPPGA